MDIDINMTTQPTNDEHCMSRCIAAALNMPANVVVNEFGEDYLNHFKQEGSVSDSVRKVKGYLKDYGVSAYFECPLEEVSLTYPTFYILAVPSLNRPNTSHAILMEVTSIGSERFTRLWDPSKNNEDKFHYADMGDLSEKGRPLDLKETFYAFKLDGKEVLDAQCRGGTDKLDRTPFHFPMDL